MKIIITNVLLLIGLISTAQSNTLSTGGVATGTGGNVTFSIGQVFSHSNLGGNYIAIEGLQQPNNTVPLPISLISFSAENINNKGVNLFWSTASENNNDYYIIEKSQDGKIFTQLTEVKSNGNDNKVETYQVSDNQPFEGITYYRLLQNDVDGKRNYSNVIQVSLNGTKSELSAFPNPTVNFLTLQLKPPFLKELSYTIFDLSGKTISVGSIKNEFTTISTNNLIKGSYILKVSNNLKTIKTFSITKL